MRRQILPLGPSWPTLLPHPATGETITCLHPPEGELWHMALHDFRKFPCGKVNSVCH